MRVPSRKGFRGSGEPWRAWCTPAAVRLGVRSARLRMTDPAVARSTAHPCAARRLTRSPSSLLTALDFQRYILPDRHRMDAMSERQGNTERSLIAADDVPVHQTQNRRSAESKLRRGKRHCPVCLSPLVKIAGRTRLMRSCPTCRAHPSDSKRCSRCGASGSIWENKQEAACQACGLHGPKASVIAEAEA